MTIAHRLQRANDVSSRSPERQALADAIVKHSALTSKIALIDERMKAADEARWEASSDIEKAEAALEAAKKSDARAMAEGRKGTAVKAARAALQDAQDDAETRRAARDLLIAEREDVTNKFTYVGLKDAIAAVLRADATAHKLIEEFRTAQQHLFDLKEAFVVLAAASSGPGVGLPADVGSFNAAYLDRIGNLPRTPSALAAKVQEWIEKLKGDADAQLDV